MEWVEVTAKSVESAKELALDRLGISVDDAEFDVVEEPRPGLFGRVRGEARVRARVKPAMVRQKHDRRGRRSSDERRPTADAVQPPTACRRRGGRRRRRATTAAPATAPTTATVAPKRAAGEPRTGRPPQ